MPGEDQVDAAPAGRPDTPLALDEPGQFFFHYTSRDAAFGSIIPSGLLRFSPFSKMRDPLEAKLPAMAFNSPFASFDDMVVGQKLLEEMTKRMEVTGKERDPIRDRVKLLCLTIDKYEQDAGQAVSPYGAGWARARMWEQYAERGQGVCLVIDKEALTRTATATANGSEGEKIICDAVRYTAQGLAGTAAATVDVSTDLTAEELWTHHFVTHQDEFLFTKLRDWESEHEYRFVIRADDDQPRYVSIKNSLTGVIVGHEFPAWQRASAQHVCTEHSILIKRINWRSPRGPRLEHLDPEKARESRLHEFLRPRT
jgi:hypothetical protein